MTGIARELVSAAWDANIDGDYRRAIYLCNKAIEQDPHLPEAHSLLKKCREELVIDEVVNAHDASSPHEARRICNELHEHVPNSAELVFTRGLYQESGDAAQADFELVLKLEAGSKDIEAIERRAESLELLGRTEEAADVWTQLVNLDESNVDALNGRAMNRLSRMQINEALEDIEKALDLDPDNARALTQRAEAELLNGRFEAALEHAAKARNAGYDGGYVDSIEGEALFRLDRYSEAVAKFAPLAEDFTAGGLDEDELISYACCLTEIGEPAEAISLLDERITAELRDENWHSAMAHALCSLGRSAEGKTHLDLALKGAREALEEQESDSLHGVAWCLAHRAAMAEKYSIAGINIESERDEAALLLHQAIQEDESVLRYAKAAREFDGIWDRSEFHKFVDT